MIDVNQPVQNPELVKCMRRLQEAPDQASEHAFFQAVMKAHFLSPVKIDPPPVKGEGQSTLKAETEIQFAGMTDEEGRTFFSGIYGLAGAGKVEQET